MKFNIQERILLAPIINDVQGNVLTLRTVVKLKEELSFSDEEIKDFEIEQKEGMIRWNAQKAQEKDIEINEIANNIIVSKLKDLDSKNLLTENILILYDKFITA